MPSGRARTHLPESPAARRLLLVCAAAVGLLTAPLAAQDAPVTKDPPPQEEGTPVPKGHEGATKPPPEPAEAQRVKLDTDILPWFKYVEQDAPLRSQDQNEDEHQAWRYTIAKASRVGAEALARHSLRDSPFANLVGVPIYRDYVGEIVHVEGRLARLEAMKTTDFLRDNEGIKQLYEGWLFPKDELYPVCILFTELPEGIRPGRKLENTWVSFDGYYFKLIRYETAEEVSKGKFQWRRAPLLIGHRPAPMPAPEHTSALSFGGTFVPAVVTVIAVVIAVAVGLTVWFRRGDRKVRSKVAEVQYQTNPFGQQPPAPPVEPGAGWNRLDEPPS